MNKSMLLLFAMLLPVVWQAQAGAGKTIGSISFLLGGPEDLHIQSRGSAEWSRVQLGLKVHDGDAIRTQKESRCEIKLLDASVIRIGESTSFVFTQAALSAQSRQIKAEIPTGQVYLNLSPSASGNSSFQIKAPTAVCAVRGTVYRVQADTATHCVVYDGAVEVGPAKLWGLPRSQSSKSLQPVEVPGPSQIPGPYEVSLEQWVKIVKGFQITVRADGKYAKAAFDPAKDAAAEWVKWNKELDQKIKR